jgi:hypothetical protein
VDEQSVAQLELPYGEIDCCTCSTSVSAEQLDLASRQLDGFAGRVIRREREKIPIARFACAGMSTRTDEKDRGVPEIQTIRKSAFDQ